MSKLNWDAEVTRCDDAAEYETLDEAIAVALAELDEGGVLAIHGEDCSVGDDGVTGCDCDVLEIRKGAQA